ncbi:hypothetical protein BVRB_4g084490 [Beta vulgaris subsp. vulgaris]|uniref:PsbQ-like protein 3, chloroplastic n=1 Tax=Beta vulgaris subsp. vulgaris TaxID=3555 RepID=A0A0J8CMT7_BETVV|nr:hypothetical protein BVRB_4g084490 [Beta vulgaris subsp. vulgaris]
MALATLVPGSSSIRCSFPVFAFCTMCNPNKLQPFISRRVGVIAGMSSLSLIIDGTMSNKTANSFDFRMTVPDQTAEEARSLIGDHAQALLDVKSLIESESWREAQRELRMNSAYLKQDIYTIIQSKEGSIRPLLRKLYADLFNNVTKLDYAARDKDVARAQECYINVAAVLNDLLSRI